MLRIRLAFAQKTFKSARMFSRPGLLLLSGVVLLAGCHTAQKVAVTSFRVVDAPARYVRDALDATLEYWREDPTQTPWVQHYIRLVTGD